jgi:HlyD family secretion protein
VIQTQLDRLVLTAPVDGIVLHRFVEAGEVVARGRPALTLTNLDDLTITVYLPADRHGEVSLGDQAVLHVNSFPGETFYATVSRIAGQIEYTSLNVQSAEGRRATVFAVELSVQNTAGKLKPGMPVRVSFSER